jgi:hypothetical protein
MHTCKPPPTPRFRAKNMYYGITPGHVEKNWNWRKKNITRLLTRARRMETLDPEFETVDRECTGQEQGGGTLKSHENNSWQATIIHGWTQGQRLTDHSRTELKIRGAEGKRGDDYRQGTNHAMLEAKASCGRMRPMGKSVVYSHSFDTARCSSPMDKTCPSFSRLLLTYIDSMPRETCLSVKISLLLAPTLCYFALRLHLGCFDTTNLLALPYTTKSQPMSWLRAEKGGPERLLSNA